MMVDGDVVAVSSSATYRVMKSEDLLNRLNGAKADPKETGINQPTRSCERWRFGEEN